ncbi:Ig-like domain-containing protein, partial [Roseisolibacter sp. H3M3-2]|uniref:Ig-like domain-containing protein n=1 Tax=Roseisolibacter sp. H3M3-2 TaxID=3031323 RepID=UPI0023D9CECC
MRGWRHTSDGARAAGAAALLTLLAACGGGGGAGPTGSPSETGTAVAPAAIGVASGGGQTGDPGSTLAAPVVVRVTSARGQAVAGAPVAFAVTGGSATVTSASAVTDAEGRAQTSVVLGAVAGAVAVTATVPGTALAATVAATVAATATACDPSTARVLAPGEVVAPAGTALCVAGSATGGEFALVPFNAATAARTRSAFVVRATGVETVADPRLRPSAARLDGRR